jgi:acetyltransferase-like isoleucine patch superfamily enzyme
MTTFAITSSDQVIGSVNYLLSNLGQSGNVGNITIPTGTLIGNTTTGVVTPYNAGGNVYGYLYQWVNLRYANNATGSSGFSTVPTNSQYFGVFNSISQAASSNPTDYQWQQVAGGFGTTKTIYYSALGGRQVLFAAASSPPSSNYVVSAANVAIDLDVVTTAAGTPGERGPIPMGYVITTADPTSASSLVLTGWFSSSRQNLTPPIGTGLTPVAGDTAYFTYPTTGVSETYTFNGSAWNTAVGQIVSGATIVANSAPGNIVTANTLPANAVVYQSLTSDQIASETIIARTIQTNTITGDKLSFNTITGDRIAANTIVATNIQTGTITATQIAGNTITANQIAANTITATQISTSYLYTGNIVSTGATLGSNTSTGYWLRYSDGAARFGGNVSIGNSAAIGSNVTIGGNLVVGANAFIGSNLTVAGLVTAGALNSNTVITTTLIPASISTGAGITSTANAIVSNNQAAGTWTPMTADANIVPTVPNQAVYVSGGGDLNASFTGTAFNPIYFNIRLRVQDIGGTGITTTLTTLKSPIYTPVASGTNYFQTNLVLSGYLDTGPASPTAQTLRYFFEVQWQGTGATNMVIRSSTNSILAQSLKR